MTSNSENIWGKCVEVYQPNPLFHKILQAPKESDSKRRLAKGEVWNDILANLTYLPSRKCSVVFQDGKGYTVPINWIWDGRIVSLTIQNSTLVPIFLFCRTGYSGLHVHQLWTPRLQKPLSYFLLLPFTPAPMPCPVQHTLPVTSQGVVVDCADSSTLSAGFWTDQPLPLGVQTMAKKWEKPSRCHRNQIDKFKPYQPSWALLTQCLRGRHWKKQWVRRTYGIHIPEQHIKSCWEALGGQNPNQHPRLLRFQNWARED